MALQRAEVLLKQRDWQGALALAQEAGALSPEDGEALAIEAWCRFQLQQGKGPYDEVLALLERATALNANSQKAHYYRGVILQRKGDDHDAMAEFERVIAINPRHTEAMRQVRIAKMRSSVDSSKKQDGSAGGFLSKLFGGDGKSGKSKKR